jgi:hypothetical protein
MFKKIILGIILGIFGTIFFAQYDQWTHKKIILLMQKVAKTSLGGNFSCSIQSVSFFAPSIVLSDLEMHSIDPDIWQWRCKRCEITCSWLQLLFKGILDQHIIIDGYECTSSIKNDRLAIEPHLMAMMAQSFLPFLSDLKSVVFKNSSFCVDHDITQSRLSVNFNSSSLRIGKQLKTTMSIGDGQLAKEDTTYVEKIALDLSCITEYVADAFDIGLHVAGTFTLPHMGNQGSCYLTGSWKSDCGRFSIRNAYNSLIIDPIIVTEREVRVNGRFPLSYAVQCIRNSLADQMIQGTAHFSAKMARDETKKIDGQVVVEDVKMNRHHLCDVGKIIFEGGGDDHWKTHVAINRYNQECKGMGYWHVGNGEGELFLKNVTDLSSKMFPYWRIKPNDFLFHVTAHHGVAKGTYETILSNRLSATTHNTRGSFSYEHDRLSAQGNIDSDHFSIDATVYPELALHHCSYKDKEDKPLIVLNGSSFMTADTSADTTVNEAHKITGSISFPFIRSMINRVFNYDVQGEGNLHIVAHLNPTEIVADVALHEATIRLPQTYNFIDGLKAHCVYSFADKSAVIEKAHISLHTGKLHCLRATTYFNDEGSLLFMHAPVLVDRCLLNVKKDLFALVSGNLLFSKKALLQPSCVQGNIIIDKARLKENLFSGLIQKQLLSYTHSVFALPDVPLFCDIAIETKSHIHVDTGFFKTNAQVNLRVKKEMHEPSVSGSILLHSGMLNFPYKPLYISKGIITFTPEQLFDPIIELVARNKIKKYDVALQIEGSLLTHHIALDATPPLTEEQIVGLLLVGAEENSLNSMMPALIVHNLKSLIFSNNQSSFFDKYFKPLLGTFNINLVPSFTDQTGRGGLRGALEITVEDRWRAVIQKNFSLTEDTKFELEFLFSDDITFRAVRDERRDLGGEVEMRWKF